MQLKDYQIKVLEVLDTYLATLREKKDEAEAYVEFQRQRGKKVELSNYCENTWDELNRQGTLPVYRDSHGQTRIADYLNRTDRLNRPIPNVCLKVPTAGGKTFLATAALGHLNTDHFKRQTGFVLWIVPSDSIYRQTWTALTNREHPYRQMLERASGGRVRLLERRDNVNLSDTKQYLCVMILMLQAAGRQNKETLRMFMDSGNYGSFFPEVDDFRANQELLNNIPNLELNQLTDSGFRPLGISIKHSLGNVLRVVHPIIVVDEGHRAYSETARLTLQGFNPCFILELSATPNTGRQRVSNILVDITGTELKNEQMIKLPINVVNLDRADWKQTLAEANKQLQELKKASISFQAASGRYIRPIMLIRVDRTGADQRDKTEIHAEDAREYLRDKLGIKPEAIAVKSASLDEIGDADLLSPFSEIRYVITKDALREGWDCPFAYILAILSRTTATTALTQMIGRVLRQPETRITGLPTLDQSYVFCFDQEVQKAVDAIRAGLQEEGMSDLGADVRATANGQLSDVTRVSVGRKDKFKGLKIFLPQVLRRNGSHSMRPLDYEQDILSGLDWNSFSFANRQAFTPDQREQMERVLTQVDVRRKEQGGTDFYNVEQDIEEMGAEGELDIAFLVRLLTDVIPNPWQAMRILKETLDTLRERGISQQRIYTNRLNLIKAMKVDLQSQIDSAAECLFKGALSNGEISFHLVSAGDQTLNWELAQTIEVLVTESDKVLRKRNNEDLERFLYEKIYEKEFNGLEKELAWYLDGEAAVHWWHRLIAKQDYCLQGWRRHRIYPDFLACIKEKKNGDVRLTLLETKGMHLSGNPDTEYKRRVFELLSLETSKKAIDVGRLDLFKDSSHKVSFRLLLEDSWRSEMQDMLGS